MLLEKYDICFFQEFYDTDSIAMIVPYEKGKYVKADEAQEHIRFLVETILNVKAHDSKKTEPGLLNEYLDSRLTGYL